MLGDLANVTAKLAMRQPEVRLALLLTRQPSGNEMIDRSVKMQTLFASTGTRGVPVT